MKVERVISRRICASYLYFSNRYGQLSLGNNLEVVSKPQIMFESKASRGLKTERTREYVSISIRGTIRHEYWRTIGH